MTKSVEKLSAGASVDKPTAEELAQLVGERLAPPRIHAYELAARLGIDPSSLSLFETGRRALPHSMGVNSYRQALVDLKRAKRQESAA